MFRSTRITLVAAAALVMGTGLAPIASAFAAPLTPSVEHENVTFAPDVEVKIDDAHITHYNNSLDVLFSVRNVGTMKSGGIPIKGECVTANGDHSVAYAWVHPGLQTGGKTQLSFKCKDGVGALVTVGTIGDTHTQNNFAEAGLWS